MNKIGFFSIDCCLQRLACIPDDCGLHLSLAELSVKLEALTAGYVKNTFRNEVGKGAS